MAEKWKHPKTPIALNDCEGQSTDRVLTWRHSRTAKSDRSRSSSSENERLIMNIFFSHFFALFGARVHFVRNVTASKKKEKLPLTPLVSPAPLSTSDELQRPCVHIHRLILGFSFHCWWRTNASQFFFSFPQIFTFLRRPRRHLKKLIIPRIYLQISWPCTSIDSAFRALSKVF